MADLNEGRIPRDRDFYSYLRRFRGWPQVTAFGSEVFDIDYRNNFEIYGAELQQIFTFGPQTVLFGGRYQQGEFETQVLLSDFKNGTDSFGTSRFAYPLIDQRSNRDFERVNLYLYSILRLTSWATLTAAGLQPEGRLELAPVAGGHFARRLHRGNQRDELRRKRPVGTGSGRRVPPRLPLGDLGVSDWDGGRQPVQARRREF